MKYLLLSLCLAVASAAGLANNITVSNVTFRSQNLTNQTVTIRFDLRWENAWRVSAGPANLDAAWVFAKWRIGTGDWQHVKIGDAPFQTGQIYNSNVASGTASHGAEFRWNYGAAGVTDAAVVEVKVFAIEMVDPRNLDTQLGVPVPAGGSVTEVGALYRPGSAGTRDVVSASNLFNSNAAVSPTGAVYYDSPGGAYGDQSGPIPLYYASGPTFFTKYVMKYETSQQQWVDFFNTLTPTQKTANDITDAAGKNTDAVLNRNGVSWSGSGDATTSLPDVAVNYVSNERVLAYLDWAGLRPMSELEFEAFARGGLASAPGQYAWVNNSIATSPYTLTAAGTPAEKISNPSTTTGNASYASTATALAGPVRVGLFAASAANPTRAESGGSFFGVMELSGNLAERVITIGNPEGRGFRNFNPSTGQPLRSDGTLTAAGTHNVAAWSTLTPTLGFGLRGGSYADPAARLLISDRAQAVTTGTNATATAGFRGVYE